MRDWHFRLIHIVSVCGFLFASGVSFMLAANIQDRIDEMLYAREKGELVNVEVYGHSIDERHSSRLHGVSGVIEEPTFLHVRFQTRNGYRYHGAVQVSRTTFERYEDARIDAPMGSWACVPPSAPEHWTLLSEALVVEPRYRWHRNTAIITGIVLLLIAIAAVTAHPAIEVLHRRWVARINRTPGPYGLRRRRLT
ncbi:MAG: hypothetical protein H6839_11230 [Planctomycetes bacterium]|nr:hypothetical protein [Planctomycetota bacterium]